MTKDRPFIPKGAEIFPKIADEQEAINALNAVREGVFDTVELLTSVMLGAATVAEFVSKQGSPEALGGTLKIINSLACARTLLEVELHSMDEAVKVGGSK